MELRGDVKKMEERGKREIFVGSEAARDLFISEDRSINRFSNEE